MRTQIHQDPPVPGPRRHPARGTLLRPVVFLLLPLVALAAACGLTGSDGNESRHDATLDGGEAQVVEIRAFDYEPGNLTIAAGTRIRFVNRDPVAHTATDVAGAWDTGLLEEGESAVIAFDTPGRYPYYCIPHPDMRALITVTED